MKLLFENWRQYLSERIDSLSPQKDEPWDIGETFAPITKLDIIEKPWTMTQEKNTLLNQFDVLKATINTDAFKGITVQNVLDSIYNLSGNSDDFRYKTKEAALEDYMTPYRYGISSLKDLHTRIKEMSYDLTKHTKPMSWTDQKG